MGNSHSESGITAALGVDRRYTTLKFDAKIHDAEQPKISHTSGLYPIARVSIYDPADGRRLS